MPRLVAAAAVLLAHGRGGGGRQPLDATRRDPDPGCKGSTAPTGRASSGVGLVGGLEADELGYVWRAGAGREGRQNSVKGRQAPRQGSLPVASCRRVLCTMAVASCRRVMCTMAVASCRHVLCTMAFTLNFIWCVPDVDVEVGMREHA